LASIFLFGFTDQRYSVGLFIFPSDDIILSDGMRDGFFDAIDGLIIGLIEIDG
jgi:hypothetical protein